MISSDTDTMRHITTVILDLDDTLWDLPLVISHAEQVIYAWFSEEYPRINERFSIADLRGLRENIALEHPTQDHDLIFSRANLSSFWLRCVAMMRACIQKHLRFFNGHGMK